MPAVVLFCPEMRYLAAEVYLDEGRLKALWPDIDLDVVRGHLEAVSLICAGDAGAGPIASLSQRERFHWLSSPRSTIIQPSPVHTGICDEPGAVLERLTKQFLSGR